MIRDICGEKTKEAHLLIQALKQQVPGDLIASTPGMALSVLVGRLGVSLEENLGLAAPASRWAVESWAFALGIIDSVTLPPTSRQRESAVDEPQSTPGHNVVRDDFPEITLSDLLLDSAQLIGQRVRVRGTYCSLFGSGWWFTVEQGDHKIVVCYAQLPQEQKSVILRESEAQGRAVVVDGVLKGKGLPHLIATSVVIQGMKTPPKVQSSGASKAPVSPRPKVGSSKSRKRATNEWHYTLNGQQAATPVSATQLKQLATSGQLKPTDRVWQDGMLDWVPASALKGLFPSGKSKGKPAIVPMPATFVVMETSLGSIKLELDGDKAPVTVNNFLSYVEDGFYDGTVFHRVIPNFIIQGGGFEPGLKQKKTKPPIQNEAPNGLSNTRGTIAMARTSDLNSATAQFFINVENNQGLDDRRSPYCVFGKVVEGMDVVDKIKAVSTGRRGPHENVPSQDVAIVSVRRTAAR
jgi:peptidyl-prolyl cis-trans isomerase B (cyclophilin B)